MRKLLLLLSLSLLCGCASEPTVTARKGIPIEEDQYGYDYRGNIVFKGKKLVGTKWVHWDSKKQCKYGPKRAFQVTKSTPTDILKSDICDHCKQSWDLHRDI